MAKVITDKKLVDELLSRGVEKIYPNRELLEKKLLSGAKIRLYCGYDPSANALHIGNAISINKLAQFQKLGHEVIFLIGDFTGMIGDPTDKKATRQKLTRKEVLTNSRHYQAQASAYLDFDGGNPAQVLYNSAWNDKLTFKDLIELSSNFTVQQMIQRDMFQDRLKEARPIYLHEFLYPLAQAYDSVTMDVDLEIGGNDQMFNMMCGRDLMKSLKNKEKFVLTLKLLTDDAGSKMGKSEGNAVFLDAKPNDMYGIIMSWPDGTIPTAFELCTNVPYEEVKKITSNLKTSRANPRNLKMHLAFEITKIYHGEKLALEAQENFIKTVQNKEMPDEIPGHKTNSSSINIVDLLVESKLAPSKNEARRLIEQGGIKIKEGNNDFAVVKNANLTIEIKKGIIVQRGKRQYLKITK